MNKICIDLDILIEYLLGYKSSVKKVEQYIGKEELYITAYNFVKLSYIIKDDDLFNRLISNLSILPLDKKAIKKLWELINLLQGIKVDEDVLINAAIIISNDAVLLTKKRAEYSIIPGLTII